MGKRLLSAALSIVLLFTITGCSSILEGETSEITPYFHAEDNTMSDSAVEISTYDEFKSAVLDMMKQHIETAEFRIATFDRDNLEESLNEICLELSSLDPLGSFATYYISCQITPIITYHDVSVNIVYKKSLSEITNISTVSSDRYLQILLSSSMSNYDKNCTFYTSSSSITADHILKSIKEQYYKNPLEIIMLPDAVVTSYPAPDKERIMDVSLAFGSGYSQTVLENMTNTLNTSIQRIISGLADGNDYDMISALYSHFISNNFYAISKSSSTLNSTAYNVIKTYTGNSEGYAMAFKALCDKLLIECQVVNGKRMGEDHFWNIVTFAGNNYHIDLTAELTDELPPTFLRGDEYMKENYWWDTSTVPECLADYEQPTPEQMP